MNRFVLQSNPPLAWLFDFHTHAVVEVGRRLDAPAVAAALAAAGVEEVTFAAKCHVGFSYYPTAVGTPHPKMCRDVFGALVAAVREAKLRVNAYISLGIDGEAARRHPEWMKHFLNGNGTLLNDDWFMYVCPFTGYTEESVLPQVREILQRYPVDGVWFDTMSALAPCYCESCRRQFEDRHNLPLPSRPDDEGWAIFGQFRFERGQQLLERITAEIHRLRPGIKVAFNQIGCMPFPGPLPAGMKHLSLDYPVNGPQSRRAALCAAYAQGLPYKADVIPTLFVGGWGDWSAAPPQRHEQLAAAIWARGATVNFGDRLHPEGRLSDISRDALKQLGQLRRVWGRLLPPASARPAPDVVVLHAETSHYGPDHRHFAIDHKTRLDAVEGMVNCLIDAGANYLLTSEYALQSVLEGDAKGVPIFSEAMGEGRSQRAASMSERAASECEPCANSRLRRPPSLTLGPRCQPSIQGKPIDLPAPENMGTPDANAAPTLVVLPQLEAISARTDQVLRRFVAGGGQVLIVGDRLPTVAGRPLAWAGVTQDEQPWLDHLYLPEMEEVGRAGDCILVRGEHRRTMARGAEAVSFAIPPLGVRHGQKFGWGIGPAQATPSTSLVLTRHRPFGPEAGSVWFLAAPLARDYYQYGDWRQAKYLAELLGQIDYRPRLRLLSPHGQVELVGYHDGDHVWAVLVNHGGESLSPGGWARTWGPLPQYEVELRLRGQANQRPATVTVNGVAVNTEPGDDGEWAIPLTVDSVLCVVHVAWTPASAQGLEGRGSRRAVEALIEQTSGSPGAPSKSR